VSGREPAQLLLAQFGQHHPDDAAVVGVGRPLDEPGVLGSVDELDRAVVAEQQVSS
jgi:hypothetical protein